MFSYETLTRVGPSTIREFDYLPPVISVSLTERISRYWLPILGSIVISVVLAFFYIEYRHKNAIRRRVSKFCGRISNRVSSWLAASLHRPNDYSGGFAGTKMNRSLMILSNPMIERTSNVELLLEAASRPQSVHEDIVEVRLGLERELMRPVSEKLPATELRNRLKSMAALLKPAAVEERLHVSETLGNLYSICFLVMMVTYLVTLLQHHGDGHLPSFDVANFFRPSSALFSSPSFSGILSGISDNFGILFVPFGWNLMSLVPYVMALSAISSVARVPFLGPLISKIFYAVLAIRFFWLMLPSFLTGVVYTTTIVLFIGWPMIRAGLPRLYILVPLVLLSIALGFLITKQDPSVRWVENPLLSLCTKLELCEEWY